MSYDLVAVCMWLIDLIAAAGCGHKRSREPTADMLEILKQERYITKQMLFRWETSCNLGHFSLMRKLAISYSYILSLLPQVIHTKGQRTRIFRVATPMKPVAKSLQYKLLSYTASKNGCDNGIKHLFNCFLWESMVFNVNFVRHMDN